MLISVDTGSKVTKLPHARDYERWRKYISDADYDKVVDAINQKVDGGDCSKFSRPRNVLRINL